MNIEGKDRLRRGILIIIVDWVCFIGWGWYNCGAVCFGIFVELGVREFGLGFCFFVVCECVHMTW